MERALPPSAKPPARHANLVARVSPEAKAGLERLAAGSGRTQAAVIEGLIAKALEDPDGYYVRAAAISAFTAAALARVTLGTVAADDAQLRAALSVVDSVSRGLFGELPPPPKAVPGLTAPDERIEALLDAFGLLDADR
jgi:predicted DNA-binding protein